MHIWNADPDPDPAEQNQQKFNWFNLTGSNLKVENNARVPNHFDIFMWTEMFYTVPTFISLKNKIKNVKKI